MDSTERMKPEEIALMQKRLRTINTSRSYSQDYEKVHLDPASLHLGKLGVSRTKLGDSVDKEGAAKQVEIEKNSGLGYV
ncbi:MAG TPA: hypothetical protein PK543_03075 [Candidatus Saccharibacteria bacterium]|nr:hypothetical protein [Candidatus Saccharibacteria bacterium]